MSTVTSSTTPASSSPTPGSVPTGTPATTQQPFASASLYVGELASDVTEALLFEVFNAVGQVSSVRVCRDAMTRRSLGYAYVNFHRTEDAERALDTMNYKNIRNKPCRIMWSHRDPSLRKSGLGNIFVNHLAKGIDNKQLFDTFSMFGNILSCKVCTNEKKESLGYGFVHYENDEAANSAIQRVDGKVIAGQKVEVVHFKPKAERQTTLNSKFTNVFVKNLDASATKEDLVKMFAPHGTVTSSAVSVSAAKDSAFAFLNFESNEQAVKAINEMNGKEFNGKQIYVGRAQKKEEREKELRDKFEQLKAEKVKKYAGVNLYVKNISDDMTDADLEREFKEFGTITKAAVMLDANKKSKGFGFVCFSNPEEATKAVTEMNGKMINSKPLYVALAQRKEQRRAQLEAQYAARQKMVGNYSGQMNMGMGMGMPVPMNMNMMGNRQMMGQMRGGMPPQNFQQQGMRQQQNFSLMPMQQQNRTRSMVPMDRNQGQMRNRQQQQQQVRNAPVNMMQKGQVRMTGNLPPHLTNVLPSPNEPLTIKALAAAPEDMRKQMIGERLFPLIKAQQGELAGKITGMLLEMDNGELIHLLESHSALQDKIEEALQVLNQSQQ